MTENTSFLVSDNDEMNDLTDEADLVIVKNTPFAQLEALLAEEVQKPPVTLDIPGRPGMAMRFNTNVESDLLQAWQKRNTRKIRGKEETDPMRLAATILASTAEALIFKGQEMTDEDGDLLNFRGVALARMLKADSTSQLAVIRKLYGFDGHIVVTMQEVLTAAGYDNEVDLGDGDEDPTTRS